MRRQPFRKRHEDARYQTGASVIESNPPLAEIIGRIAINWSGVEVHLALALGSMVGIENPTTVAVFGALRNHRVQRDVLRAAGVSALSDDDLELLDAILLRHDELSDQRNKVVHGIWGRADHTSADDKNGIVWSSQQDHARALLNDYHMSEVWSPHSPVASREHHPHAVHGTVRGSRNPQYRDHRLQHDDWQLSRLPALPRQARREQGLRRPRRRLGYRRQPEGNPSEKDEEEVDRT